MVLYTDVHFLVGKSMRVIAASNQASSEYDVEAGVSLLIRELHASYAFV